MVLTVSRARRSIAGIFLRSDERMVTRAASRAMSLPLPRAIPTSERASAALSLMPSPAMATTWPPRCRSRM